MKTKAQCYVNTELAEVKPRASVETIHSLSHVDKDIVRTFGKPKELSRNDLVTHIMRDNRLHNLPQANTRWSDYYEETPKHPEKRSCQETANELR